MILLQAGGTIDLGGDGERVPRTPSWTTDENGRLKIKIGTGSYGWYQDWLYFPATDAVNGAIEFRIEDTDRANNAGSYAVRVIVIPAAMLPADADDCPASVCKDR
jgi:hypothetical protein